MPLIACNCPNCCGPLEFDDSRDVMYCQYCGTKVLREHITNITNNITLADGYQLHDADWYYRNAYDLLNDGRFKDASEIAERMFHDYPTDPRINKLRYWINAHPEVNRYNDGYHFAQNGSRVLPVINGVYVGSLSPDVYLNNLADFKRQIDNIDNWVCKETDLPPKLRKVYLNRIQCLRSDYSVLEKMARESQRKLAEYNKKQKNNRLIKTAIKAVFYSILAIINSYLHILAINDNLRITLVGVIFFFILPGLILNGIINIITRREFLDFDNSYALVCFTITDIIWIAMLTHALFFY